jgi:hypothetical protein
VRSCQIKRRIEVRIALVRGSAIPFFSLLPLFSSPMIFSVAFA